MKKNPQKNKISRGFTLVELLVAIFIFSLITVGIVSVFVSSVISYGKSKAAKNVKENAEFALNSIAKDVRMGKVERENSATPVQPKADGSLEQYLMVARNKGGKVCYYLDRTADSSYLGMISADGLTACPAPSATVLYNKLIDFTGTDMDFGSTSGFYSFPTDIVSANKKRGWVEINLNIKMKSGKEMSADQINIQTIVSSRDYGWEGI